jgi:hypothetical protein
MNSDDDDDDDDEIITTTTTIIITMAMAMTIFLFKKGLKHSKQEITQSV